MSRKGSKAWTLAGAARAAREARIATVKFTGEAPIARRWHVSKLLNAYQYHLAHLGDREAARVMLFGGLGYRPPFPDDWPSAVEMVLADEARYLAEAELYVLTPQMCDVVIAAALSLTREDLELAGEEDLPGLTGVVVLPRPVLVRAVTGDLGDDRAYTWRFPSQIQGPGAGPRGLRDIPAVRMSAYHDSNGPVRPDTFTEFAARARAEGTPLPPLLLDSVRCLPLRYKATPGQVETLAEFAAGVRRAGDANREQQAAAGMNENRVIGEYTVGDVIDDRDDTFMPRFLYAFWRLCEQRIAVAGDAGVNHSAQVVAARAGVSPDVRIVRLRRAEQDGDERQGDDGHQWHHRWVVRMHKVRQWYPAEQKHRVIYRGPYVKGPADKPLLGGETVRGLIR